MSSDIAIALADVHHHYGADPVIDGVSLEVSHGDALALLGPSGCGKTTLLRLIAGLEKPTQGSITLDGAAVAGQSWTPPERRKVGMVFQDWALFPHLSVADNVGYGLDRGMTARVDETLDMVGMADFSSRMPATLSGGQQQRVALARALAARPSILLLDEPFSNLDAALRHEVRAEVRQLLLDLDITSVFVTHDQDEAFVVGDQVGVMRGGKIEQLDHPSNLYTKPHSRFVAEFVGAASFMPGRADGNQVTTPLGQATLMEPATGDVSVLLRPEYLEVRVGGESTVELVEFYGHDAMVLVKHSSGTVVRVRTEATTTLRRGDAVTVAADGRPLVAFPE